MVSSALLALLLAAAPAHAKKPVPPPPAAAAAPAVPAAAPIDPAFEKDIPQLLAVTGAAAMGEQVMDQMLASMKPMAPQLPDTFWTQLRVELTGESLIELVVPIYAKHLSPEDVKALIAFYESPAGKKLIAVQPAITAESMSVGQAWGQEVAMKVVAKMQAQ